MKKKLITITLIAMLALTACGSSESETDENGKSYTIEFDSGTNQLVTYNDEAISFEVPESWVVSEDGIQVGNDGVLIVSGSVVNDAPDLIQEEYQDQIIQLAKDSFDDAVNEVESELLTISGDTPAFYFVLSGDIEDIPVTIYGICFTDDDVFYNMYYMEIDSSSTNHSKDIESVFNSIKLEG